MAGGGILGAMASGYLPTMPAIGAKPQAAPLAQQPLVELVKLVNDWPSTEGISGPSGLRIAQAEAVPGVVRHEVVLEKQKLGRFIGPQGSCLKELQTRSSCGIFVCDKEPPPGFGETQRLVVIVGTHQNVSNVAVEVNKFLLPPAAAGPSPAMPQPMSGQLPRAEGAEAAAAAAEATETAAAAEATEAVDAAETVEAVDAAETAEAVDAMESVEAAAPAETVEAVAPAETVEAVAAAETAEATVAAETAEATVAAETAEAVAAAEALKAGQDSEDASAKRGSEDTEDPPAKRQNVGD
jgi:hypothetical protein